MKSLTLKTLNPSDIAKKLALIASGALLATFLLAPLAVGADHDDPVAAPPAPATFVLEATNGRSFTFQLIENGNGLMELTYVVPAPERVIDED